MSQYPSPYSPPPSLPYGGNYPMVQADPRGPAKRAGLMMIVLGGLLLGFGLCIAGAGQMVHSATLPPELQSQLQQMESQTGMTFAAFLGGIGVVMCVFAVVGVVLGVLVRRGTLIPIILGIVETSLILLLIGLIVLFGAAGAISRGGGSAMAGIFMWLLPFALFALQLVWLISAAGASTAVALAGQQYQAQYWQYQQNMQAYAQPGYGQPGYGQPGYGQLPPNQYQTGWPPSPPPPAAPAPPPPAPGDSDGPNA